MRVPFKPSLALAAIATFCIPQISQAATLVVDVTGVQTFDAFEDASNTVNLYNIGAGSILTGFAYNVTITTLAAGSYLSEASIYYTDSDVTTGVVTRPGVGDSFSGTGTYTGSADLVALGLSFAVGDDGLLRLEFAESFDDAANAADAIFNSGTLTFTYTPAAAADVPEPASWAMMVAGFGGVGFAMRRGRKAAPRVRFA